MPAATKPVPEGFHTATPYLIVDDPSEAIEFYGRAFGATEISRHESDGRVRHAEIKVGDSPIMLSSGFDFAGVTARPPRELAGVHTQVYLYVEDADAAQRHAVAAGATELAAVTLQWYGDRSGGVRDPFGHVWWIGTRVEELTPEQARERRAR